MNIENQKLQVEILEEKLKVCFWQEETFKAKQETVKSNKSLLELEKQKLHYETDNAENITSEEDTNT